MKKYVSETIGTFAMVFCGTGAIIINDINPGAIGHIGIAITFGLIVMAMIYAFGEISGAHLNPAVTFSFWLSGRFKGRHVAPYITAQIAGAVIASILLKLLFMNHVTLGATIPNGSYLQSFILEIILSFFLMLVIINVSTGAKELGVIAGLAIGSVVLLEALFAGPISGASMNPARSLAPALVSGNLASISLYLIAPFIGMSLSVVTCRFVKNDQCCPYPDGCKS